MVVPCIDLLVPVSAKFEVTLFEIYNDTCPTPCTECQEPCSVSVKFTWKNTGGVGGRFEPAIVVNGTRTGSGTQQNISPGQEYTEIFDLIDLINGTYTICPDPND